MDVASVTSASTKAPIQTILYVFKRNNNYLNCHQASKLEVETLKFVEEKLSALCFPREFLIYINANGARSKWPSE